MTMRPMDARRSVPRLCLSLRLVPLLLLTAWAGCPANPPCDRQEDCEKGYTCVPAIRSCIELPQADLRATEDLALPEEPADMSSGARWSTGMAATTSQGGLSAPSGVCYAGGRLYVSDTGNHRVLVFDSLNEGAIPIAAIGRPDLNKDPVAAPASARTLSRPLSLWCNATVLLVADSGNHRVLVFGATTPTGGAAEAVIGQADLVSGDSNRKGAVAANTLNRPTDVFWDGIRVFIADAGNHRVVGYAAGTAAQLRMLSSGSANIVFGQRQYTESTLPGMPSASALSTPAGLSVEGSRIGIADADYHRVLVYDIVSKFTPGTALLANGAYGQGSLTTGDAGSGAGGLNGPAGVRVAAAETFLADQKNNRVLVYGAGLPAAGKFAAGAVAALGQQRVGAPTMPAGSGAADLKEPTAVATGTINGETVLFVADTGNNRVQIFRARAAN